MAGFWLFLAKFGEGVLTKDAVYAILFCYASKSRKGKRIEKQTIYTPLLTRMVKRGIMLSYNLKPPRCLRETPKQPDDILASLIYIQGGFLKSKHFQGGRYINICHPEDVTEKFFKIKGIK